jgi:hypothetical protein
MDPCPSLPKSQENKRSNSAASWETIGQPSAQGAVGCICAHELGMSHLLRSSDLLQFK